MAYVPPNSVVKLLLNVPIDASFDHTLWFASVSDQTSYFNSTVWRTFSNVSYVRKGRGAIKVECPADQLYGCNYMMYQNTSYSNKWFYAFCNVEYVSDKTSLVTFAIDPLQTWFFEMQLGQCYVEREHADHDVAGDNLVPEGLELGDYVYIDNDYDWSHIFTSYDVVVYSSFSSSYINNNWTFADTQGRYLWGIYTGLNVRVFRSVEQSGTITLLNSFFTAVVSAGKSDGVVAIIMIPHEAISDELEPQQISHTVPKITHLDRYYTPRNNKLLTAPYCFIEAQNCEGATAVFPQEYFGGTNPNVCQFMITYGISAAPVALCVPINYKGSEYNYPEGLFINNFTQCSYNIDVFKAYMAQSLSARVGQNLVDEVHSGKVELGVSRGSGPSPHSTSSHSSTSLADRTFGTLPTGDSSGGNVSSFVKDTMLSAAGQNFAGAIGTAVLGIGLATGSAESILGNIYDTMGELYAKAIQAPHNTGSNTPDYFTSNRLKGFWFFHRTIRQEFAQMIDSYFDRFGYATHKVKIPNIHARIYWTYTKTIGCQVSGSLPADAIVAIQNIFDHGITFWANAAHFGDYSLVNSIIH